jgi:hypothetical protein
MGLLKSAADVVYTIRFLKLLVTPFEDTDAFKAGIIDKDGKRNKDFSFSTVANREAYSDHYTSFHRLVFNLKRIMAKAPGGQSVVARYGAALALIKEHGNLNNNNVEKIHNKTGIDTLDVLAEQSQWYVLSDGSLGPGMYRMRNESLTDICEEVRAGDQVKIEYGYPAHEILGVSIYEGVHVRSGQRVLFSAAEISR